MAKCITMISTACFVATGIAIYLQRYTSVAWGRRRIFPNPYAVHPIPEGAPVFAGTLRAKVRIMA